MYLSGIFLLTLLTAASNVHSRAVKPVQSKPQPAKTRTASTGKAAINLIDQVVQPPHYTLLCCPAGKLSLLDSHVFVAKIASPKHPGDMAHFFTSTRHFPSWYEKLKYANHKCVAQDVVNPITVDTPWFDYKNSQYPDEDGRKKYKAAIEENPSRLYFTFFGFCEDETQTKTPPKNKPHVRLYNVTDPIKIDCITRGTKIRINNAIVRGEWSCFGGNPMNITDILRQGCEGKQFCTVDVSTYDLLKKCNSMKKIAVVDVTCNL